MPHSPRATPQLVSGAIGMRFAVAWMLVVGATLAAALPCRAIAADTVALPPEAEVVEQVLRLYAGRDWNGMLGVLESKLAANGEPIIAGFASVARHMGPFEGSVLAGRKAVDRCWENTHVVRHRSSNAVIRLQACPEGADWKIAFLQLVPSTRTLVDVLFLDEMAKRLQEGLERPYCTSWPTTPGDFDCRALVTRTGETLAVQLTLRGPGNVVVAGARAIPPPEASRALLEPAARRVLDQYSRRAFQEIADDAGGSLRDPLQQPQLIAMLAAIHRLGGEVKAIEWRGLTGSTVQLDVSFASASASMQLTFTPDAGEWRLSGLEPGFTPDSPEWNAISVALLQPAAARLVGDPGAVVDCADPFRMQPGKILTCALAAHGRAIPVGVHVSADKDPLDPDALSLSLTDFPMIVHGMIAGAEPELGWSISSVDCDAPPTVGGTSRCRVHGPEVARDVTVHRVGQTLRFVDVAEVPSSAISTGHP